MCVARVRQQQMEPGEGSDSTATFAVVGVDICGDEEEGSLSTEMRTGWAGSQEPGSDSGLDINVPRSHFPLVKLRAGGEGEICFLKCRCQSFEKGTKDIA